jgi:hypothetical protein
MLRLLRSFVLVLSRGADAFLAREIAETRAQRGDITGLQEATVERSAARRRRIMSLGTLSMWAGLLLIPSLTPWPRLLYAAYSVLWLLPRRPRRILST